MFAFFVCFVYMFWFLFVADAADVTDDTDIVDPWAESDTKLEYDPWEPRFPSTAWGG